MNKLLLIVSLRTFWLGHPVNKGKLNESKEFWLNHKIFLKIILRYLISLIWCGLCTFLEISVIHGNYLLASLQDYMRSNLLIDQPQVLFSFLSQFSVPSQQLHVITNIWSHWHPLSFIVLLLKLQTFLLEIPFHWSFSRNEATLSTVWLLWNK